MSKVEKTLDWYVENKKYDEEYTNYIPSQEAIEFSNLVNMIYGTELENDTPVMHYQMFDAMHGNRDICIVAHRGSGKALGINEVVYDVDGTPIAIKDVKLGQEILSPTGTTKVIWKSKVFENDAYNLTVDDNRTVLSCKHHFWRVNQTKKTKYDYVLTTEELFERYRITLKKKINKPSSYEYTSRIKLNEPIDFGSSDEPEVEYKDMASLLSRKNEDLNSGSIFVASDTEELGLATVARGLFIPKAYKKSSIKYRFSLLNEIIRRITDDSKDLLVGTKPISIRVVSYTLANDLKYIGNSLGIHTSTNNRYDDTIVTFSISKKYSTITNIQHVGIQKTQCISVDNPDKMFLTTNFLPTMNSTSMAQNLFFYVAIYEELPRIGKVDFAIYVSDTVDNGCKTMTHNMEYTWQTSAFLQKMIPTAKFTMGRWSMTNLNGFELVVRTYGAVTGIRGAREKNRRPKLAVIDDVLSDSTAKSESKLGGIKDTIFKAVEEAMHPLSLQIIIGTPFHSKCVVSEAVASNNYTNIVFPICEKFPCTKEEFKGSWTDRFPYEVVRRKYEKAKNGKGKMTLQGFYQELMLTPSSKDRKMIDIKTMFKKQHRAVFFMHQEKYNFYITTDFATTDKESSDFSFILVWAYGDDGKMWVVDGMAGKHLMDVNIDVLFEFVEKWSPETVGIEINGQQGGFVPWIRREMEQREIYFDFASSSLTDSTTNEVSNKDGIISSGNKMTRLSVIYPDICHRKFGFMHEDAEEEWYLELMAEFHSVVPEGITHQHDDAIDAFSQIQYMDLQKPYYNPIHQQHAQNRQSQFNPFSRGTQEISYTSSYIV